MSNRLKLSIVAVSITIGIGATYVYVASRRHLEAQAEAMTLIRDLDSIDQQLSQASREFGFALRHFVESAEGDSSAVRQSHRTLVDSVNRSIAIVSRLEPPDSDHGAAFISAQRKFLLVQRGIIREDFGKLLELLDDATLAQSQRAASIQDIVDTAFAETEKEFAAVHSQRQKFAVEFGIHLMAQP